MQRYLIIIIITCICHHSDRFCIPAGASVEMDVSQMGELTELCWGPVDDFSIRCLVDGDGLDTVAMHGTGLKDCLECKIIQV